MPKSERTNNYIQVKIVPVSIYGLYEHDISDIKYVGKTSFSLQRRLSLHCSQAKNKPLTKRNAWILKLSHKPQIVMLESTDSLMSNSREKHWIEVYGLEKLVNGNNGGGGNNGMGIKRNNSYISRFLEYLNSNNYRLSTKKNYKASICKFIKYFEDEIKSPKEISCIQIESYIQSFSNSNSKNCHITALKLFYTKIMNQPNKIKNSYYEYFIHKLNKQS